MIKLFISLLCFSTSVLAFEFEEIVSFTLSDKQGVGIFHHLETGGRESIAINDEVVGVVWEDNSNGKNAVYFVSIGNKNPDPSKPIMLSSIGYLPVISSLESGFIVAWENDVSSKIIYIDNNGAILDSLNLGDNQERQISLDMSNTGLLAAWIAGGYRASNLVTANIKLIDNKLSITDKRGVDSDSLPIGKEYPTILFIDKDKHIVSWQDRRTKTNVLRYSLFNNEKYTNQKRINATVQKSKFFGQGSSAVRGTLAKVEDNNILAVWMDKRSEKSGYEVFSSLSENNGARFSGNIKVQDTFGNEIPQWNASIVNNENHSFVIWNDGREDDQDIYYSYKVDNDWSEDAMFELSSLEWDQYAPQAVLDVDNILHLVWINKVWLDTARFETSIMYSRLKMQLDN